MRWPPNPRRRLRQMVTILGHPVEHLQLRRALRGAKASGYAAGHHRVGYKYLGTYLAGFMTRSARRDAVAFHYRHLVSAMPHRAQARAWTGGICLWRHDDTEGRSHDVMLRQSRLAPMEGETELCFRLDGRSLFTLTFTIVDGTVVGLPRIPAILVGGIQGAYSARTDMRYAARTNHEIAPATMVLIATRAAAEAIGVAYIVGTPAERQAANRYANGATMLDYDGFWTQAGGQRNDDGFYVLRTHQAADAEEPIAGRHRARTRRRRAIKADLRTQMLAEMTRTLRLAEEEPA